jgi:myo-inositol-1(or 4)-monophosphatase
MDYRPAIEEWLRQAAKLAMQHFGKVSGTVKPGDNNQVLTEADVAIGKYLVEVVAKTFPDHNIIDEEAGAIDKKSKYTWVIDPIEGTSNFAAGLPNYGIMVGLLEDSTPLAGGVIAPAFNKLYLAQKDKGATVKGKPIHVTTETKLSNVLVSVGLDGYADDPQRTQRECTMLAELIVNIRNYRNTGCEATDPMYVAEGRYGARLNLSSRIWDNVAPQIIAEEAGALWTSVDGKPLDYTDPLTKAKDNFTFCVASPTLHKQIQTIVQKHGIA